MIDVADSDVQEAWLNLIAVGAEHFWWPSNIRAVVMAARSSCDRGSWTVAFLALRLRYADRLRGSASVRRLSERLDYVFLLEV